MISDLALLVIFGGMGVIFASNLKGAIFNGFVFARFKGVDRATHPIAFWIQTVVSAFLACVCFAMASLALLNLLGVRV